MEEGETRASKSIRGGVCLCVCVRARAARQERGGGACTDVWFFGPLPVEGNPGAKQADGAEKWIGSLKRRGKNAGQKCKRDGRVCTRLMMNGEWGRVKQQGLVGRDEAEGADGQEGARQERADGQWQGKRQMEAQGRRGAADVVVARRTYVNAVANDSGTLLSGRVQKEKRGRKSACAMLMLVSMGTSRAVFQHARVWTSTAGCRALELGRWRAGWCPSWRRQ